MADAAIITVNGKQSPLAAEITLRQLIESLGMGQQAVAAEVNGKLVRRALHEATVLQAGDVIELVSLVGGG
ncbi:MAG TPA: sulfur carrier protein ThiS [Phycisphaerales bacterium]|nr:sulfur carrier protein ThiS [Phycisphaerales bacterium]